MISGGIERDQWHLMDQKVPNRKSLRKFGIASLNRIENYGRCIIKK